MTTAATMTTAAETTGTMLVGAAHGGGPDGQAPPSEVATGGPLRIELLLDGGWVTVCEGVHLTTGRGVAVLLPDGRQAALFLDRAGQLHAIDNRDPFTGASVLSRGLLGCAAGTRFVASPLLKQRFALTDGRCLDDDAAWVETYQVRASGPASALRGTAPASASAPAPAPAPA